MAVCIANNGTALTRADIYYNDNGTIKSISDMDVWTQNGNNVYKFPQKDHCILNLDHTSFSLNKLEGASTYLTNDFELWQDTTRYNNMGDIINVDPNSANGFKVNNLDKYWWVNNMGNVNLYFGSGSNFFANQTFTITMTVKFEREPTTWHNLWRFSDNDKFRLEWNGIARRMELYGENNFINGAMYFNISIDDLKRQFATLAVVVNGRNVTGYQNGQQVFQGTISRNFASGIEKIYICGGRFGDAFGSGVYISNFAMWKAALSEQELNDYYKCAYVL